MHRLAAQCAASAITLFNHGSVTSRIARSLAMICLSSAILRARASPVSGGTPACTACWCLAHCCSSAAREVQSPACAASDIWAVKPASCSYMFTTSFEVMVAPPSVQSDYRVSLDNGPFCANFRVPQQISSNFFQFVTNPWNIVQLSNCPLMPAYHCPTGYLDAFYATVLAFWRGFAQFIASGRASTTPGATVQAGPLRGQRSATLIYDKIQGPE